MIAEAVKNLQVNMINAWMDTENAALETLKEGGMTVVEPSDEVLAGFREAMQSVYDTYGAQFKDEIAAIEAIEY